jgi:hypothetical protein
MDQETITKVRAAIKDRATWFALLYRAFAESLPEEKVEAAARKAIFEFGRIKAKSDPTPFNARGWVDKHIEKGSAEVFASEVEFLDGRAIQQMKQCPLVDAWREMGCTPKEVDLFCDIAMEGDRGRAAAHDIRMQLDETLAKGHDRCRLVIYDGEKVR